MRVLISGGGTGGHIYPALSVAAQLQKHYNAEILYLGSDDGLETRLVPPTGLRFATIQAGKLHRYISWRTVMGIVRVPIGMAQAIRIVRRFKPDVAFSSGGYVAVPAGLAARLSGTPILMHQQDVAPNLSNRLLVPLATRISVAFADSVRYFPAHKTLHLGNPIRQAILDVRNVPVQEARTKLGLLPDVPVLLVTGGSQGARHLNQVVCQALPELLKQCQVLQISGDKLFDETQELARQYLSGLDEATRQRYKLVAYMNEEMSLALQAAEIVLGRSGASMLSELAVLGKPAILVPLAPGIGGSPQEVNAAMFAAHKAAEVILDNNLKPELLIERVTHMFSSTNYIFDMAKEIQKLAKPDATQEIVDTIVQMQKGAANTTPGHESVQV